MKTSERLQRLLNQSPRHIDRDQLEIAAIVAEVRELEGELVEANGKIESYQEGLRGMIAGLAGTAEVEKGE